ncbi:amino acid adenylation domain-containing protein [Streptomyces sp. JNUCC 64]
MTSATRHVPLTRSARSLSELLSHAARLHPHRTALADGVRSLDYRTLDAVADRVADRLDALGIGRDDRVALLGPRDARVLALLHGVLRAGATAVMADPEWSPADLGGRLDAVRVRHVLTTEAAVRGPRRRPAHWLDVDGWAEAGPLGRRPVVRGADGDLAYLSFTSGSSGAPKAVAVTHANAVHYARALTERLGFGPDDGVRVAHVTTLAADLGHTAWLLALAVGGSVHLVPDGEVRDPDAFWAALGTAGVNVLKTTPSHLGALLEGRPSGAPALHTVLLGGEALPRALAAGLLDTGVAARVGNHYGPTETTVGATCFLATSAGQLPEEEPTVPIGTGIGEVELRLLDGAGRPVPDGTAGELFIGGRGVSAGYFGRPAETARSFVRRDGSLLYRTGDLCRRRPDGSIVFLGRADRQVKVRGFRVDLTEVERAVEAFPGVGGCAVLVRDTALGNQLVAAVRLTDEAGESGRSGGAGESGRSDGSGSSSGGPGGSHGPIGSIDSKRSKRSGGSGDAPDGVRPDGEGSGGGEAPGNDRGPQAEGAVLARLGVHLRDRLPGYAVPQPILVLPRFPVSPNGKLDRERLAALVTEVIEARAGRAGPGGAEPAAPADLRQRALVRSLTEFWAGALGLALVGPHADVLELGGDSILAMRTIALLRRSGLRVGYDDFYRHPTAAALAATATRDTGDDDATGDAGTVGATGDAAPASPAPEGEGAGRLAPAQRWLLRQPLDDLRHWNQSVVLRCRAEVDPTALATALAAVLERHPALRRPLTADGYGEPRPVAGLDPLSFSRLPRAAGALARTVAGLCTALHRGMDPAAGRLLRAHLFTGPPGTDDRLALIVHHLVVDGVSWRVLLDDLAHAYRAAVDRKPTALPPTPDFYAWAARTPPPPPAGPAAAVSPASPVGPADPVSPGAVTAGTTTTATTATAPKAIVWTLDEDGTTRLIARHGAGPGLEAFLLTAFTDAVTGATGRPRLTVEVETHGRDAVGDPGDHLDTVGWFTAVKRVTVRAPEAPGTPAGAGSLTARAEETREALRRAPVLPMDTAEPAPETGFNFLGTFRPPDEPALDWTVADEQAGTARCVSGDPLYALRLTARVVGERLVCDLVYGAPRIADRVATELVRDFGRAVAREAGATAGAPVRSPLSTSGQLLLTGRLETGGTAGGRLAVTEPARVLLTGATGYLGGHLLTALTRRGAHVVCLVRADDDEAAVRRLGADHERIEVVAGDIRRDGLGLSPAGLARARDAQVVVHAAADVRLVASPAELARTNHTAVRRLLEWVTAHAPDARFHHVSTLAVSGGVEGPVRRFGEADLWIGQRFRTPYERTKFDAEETVRAWAATGHPAYVHRSGHIAAHSRTGAFQANAGDNRIYQLVRGYLLAGAAPRRPGASFAFSHVDTVAAGIAALAVDPLAAPGAYHVETPYETPHDRLVDWLAGHGYRVALTDDETFAAALARAERRHPAEAGVAAAWSLQEERNVAVDRAYTVAALDRLGVRFTEPTARWWSAALTWAADAGFLPPVRPSDGTLLFP